MGKKILLIDDDADLLDIMSTILVSSGYEIQSVLTREKVFDEIKDFGPDLILMDVMLANMDGRVICREIKSKADTKALPVILISGTHDLADSLNKQGAPNDFVAKPFDIDFLLQKIELQLAA